MSSGLKIRRLCAEYPENPGVRVLHGVDLEVAPGEAVGIVGETGSGKSTIARCVMGLLPWAGVTGSIRLGDDELVGMGEEELRRVRWRRVAMAFQGVGGGFDPVRKIGDQIAEPIRVQLGLPRREAIDRARGLLDEVGLPADRFGRHPHELSGGEKQRAMVAMALACDPEVLIVDEPTTGLDALTRGRVLDLLDELRRRRDISLVVISHDLGDIVRLADRLVVLYAGRVVEEGPTRPLLEDPHHPYTWGLVGAFPTLRTTKDLRGIRGSAPAPGSFPSGCAFHPRCVQAIDECRTRVPDWEEVGDGRGIACLRGGLRTLLELREVSKSYGRGRDRVSALEGVSLRLRAGEVVAVVGPSGSGKSTLGRLAVLLEPPDSGRVLFEGEDLTELDETALRARRRRLQLIFQEPFEAVNTRFTVGAVVAEPLVINRIGSKEERESRVAAVLEEVGLPGGPAFRSRLVCDLSGGQAQRVVLARALVLDPQVLVADEPVSMLDASEQAKVVLLLRRLQVERGLGLLLITHDLALVGKVADRIVVLDHGRIVDEGPSHRVISRPAHPLVRELIGATSDPWAS
ncbi:MAG TPA: ABC transporter ATP-binding protein [Actinobacteria bacterium]|nr:ABC transporter ATP-binding protein [Actinomycetota bacterium]